MWTWLLTSANVQPPMKNTSTTLETFEFVAAVLEIKGDSSMVGPKQLQKEDP